MSRIASKLMKLRNQYIGVGYMSIYYERREADCLCVRSQL